MAGHNKWSKIKHKKGAADAKRSKVWTKIIREVTVAARLGGADVSANPRLRKAVDDARAANIPKDTLSRALSKGAGGDEADYEELRYEGYGPGGVALMIDCTTDNRNRAAADVRSVLRKGGGSLGKDGSVAFLFTKLGQLAFDKAPDEGGKVPTEDDLMEIGLEHGADDVTDEGDSFLVTCAPDAFNGLREAFDNAGYVPALANIEQVPSTSVTLTGDDAATLLKLIDKLEDLDDVQNVWANFDIADDEIERLTA
jgi:YebC/PmpR family DNA-binding regulatory protein